MKTWLTSIVWVLTSLCLVPLAHAHGDDQHQIAGAMRKQFDRPGAPLVVAPVTVVGDYAVAGWTQTGKGGRALLHKDGHSWSIFVCAGDGLTQANVLHTTGMTAANAERLSKAVIAAESKLSKDKLKLFASFEGVVKVHGSSGHGEHGTHGAKNAHGKQ